MSGEILFHLANGEFAEMKNARRQNGIGLPLAQDLHEMIKISRTATRNDGNSDDLADAARDELASAMAALFEVTRGSNESIAARCYLALSYKYLSGERP